MRASCGEWRGSESQGEHKLRIADYLVLGFCAIPFIYYSLALFSSWLYFSVNKPSRESNSDYTPPISCLKPIKGLDHEDYKNFASFCLQDYPEYEILFCVDPGDPAIPVIELLIRDFPERQIRILYGSGRNAINDKVGRLVRLVNEARHDLLVITDGDVRVGPDYLGAVAAAFRDPKVGGATCLYASTDETKFIDELQAIGMASDFFAGILVAWKLDGVKFMFGQTMAMTRKANKAFGGYQKLENLPADDLLAGRLIAEQGYDVKLLPYVVKSVADYQSLGDLLHKRVRWMTVMRKMRPWGHLGLVFTWGLPWAIVACITQPSAAIAIGYLGSYLAFRVAMTWMIGIRGMRQPGLWKKMALVPLWDALAFGIWLASFTRSTIRWRGISYFVREGRLVPVNRSPA